MGRRSAVALRLLVVLGGASEEVRHPAGLAALARRVRRGRPLTLPLLARALEARLLLTRQLELRLQPLRVLLPGLLLTRLFGPRLLQAAVLGLRLLRSRGILTGLLEPRLLGLRRLVLAPRRLEARRRLGIGHRRLRWPIARGRARQATRRPSGPSG